MANVDELSDQAMGQSKLAMQTHDDAHHKAAKAAHENAFVAAGGAARPSLADHHLQQAALHGQHADPTTALGKSSIAHRATAKARASGSADDHEAAATAHQDAAHAHGADGGIGGGARVAYGHQDAAHGHQAQACKIKNPPKPFP